ncbi:peptidase S8, partial [bacterium]
LLGLAAAWPLMLTDPDELSLVVSSGIGERTYWVTRAGWVTLVAGLFVTLILALTWRRLKRDGSFRLAGKIITAAAVVAVIAVYFVFGVTGSYGERMFVILKDQADFSQIPADLSWQERRAQVYEVLVTQANNDQKEIRVALDRLGIRYTSYYLINAIEVQSGPFVRLWLNNRSEVDRIIDSPMMRPLPEPLTSIPGTMSTPTDVTWNISLIGADRVWSEFGINGEGVLVGVSDSGIQGNHPEISERYAGNTTSNSSTWLDPWNNTVTPTDISGHGTAVTSVILGKHTGVAPGAAWIGCVNLARNLGNPAYYVDCMQFLLAPFPQGGDPFVDGD